MGDIPTPRRWRRFIDHLLGLGLNAFDLLVLDTAMSFVPAAENNPSALRKALNELRVVADAPAGVLLLHQTPASRGRSRSRAPLRAFADILIGEVNRARCCQATATFDRKAARLEGFVRVA